MINSFDELIAAVKKKPKKKIVIVSPEGSTVIKLVKQALEAVLAYFILVGDEEKIKSMSADAGFDSHLINIINIADQKEAAEEAVRLVLVGSANAIMKGNLPTATFMRAVLDKQKGLNDNYSNTMDKIYSEIIK